MKTITYGVREFHAHLGDALRFVKRGDRVVVTSHGRPVAVVSRPESRIPRLSALERKIERFAAEGLLRPGGGRRIAPYTVPAIGGLTDQLLRDRR